MWRCFVLLLLVASFAGGNVFDHIRGLHRLHGRIIGGTTADITKFPYQLSLELNGEHHCGASIISDVWAVTAAHCVYGIHVDEITLRGGTSIRGSGGNVYNIDEYHIHPVYDAYSNDYDVAIIRVSIPFVFGSKVAPIDMVNEDEEFPQGTTTVVSGWGYTSENGPLSKLLMKVSVPIIDRKRCNEIYDGYITDRMLCAGISEGGKDACHGDSGGPLTTEGRLVGIVSWGYGCSLPKYPGVYTNVAAVRFWISSITGI